MPLRFQAPKHCSGVFASTGREYRASKGGIIELADDAPAGDRLSLLSAGCVPIPSDPASDPPAGKAKPAQPPESAPKG